MTWIAPDQRVTDGGARLTIGVAWNGVGSPNACFQAGQDAPFVAEVLVSPIDAATAEKAAAVARDFDKVRILPPGDSGIYSAWNKLVAHCRTSHIVFHGVDDLIRSDISIGAALEAIGEQDMLVFSIALATPQGRETAIYHHRETHPPALSFGRYANPACPEVAWPVSVVREVGMLDEGFRIAGDVDLYFRVRPHVTRVDCEAVLVTMLDGGMSVMARNTRKVWLENRRIARKYGHKVPVINLMIAGTFLNLRHLLYRVGGPEFADRTTDVVRALVGKPPRYSLMHEFD